MMHRRQLSRGSVRSTNDLLPSETAKRDLKSKRWQPLELVVRAKTNEKKLFSKIYKTLVTETSICEPQLLIVAFL